MNEPQRQIQRPKWLDEPFALDDEQLWLLLEEEEEPYAPPTPPLDRSKEEEEEEEETPIGTRPLEPLVQGEDVVPTDILFYIFLERMRNDPAEFLDVDCTADTVARRLCEQRVLARDVAPEAVGLPIPRTYRQQYVGARQRYVSATESETMHTIARALRFTSTLLYMGELMQVFQLSSVVCGAASREHPTNLRSYRVDDLLVLAQLRYAANPYMLMTRATLPTDAMRAAARATIGRSTRLEYERAVEYERVISQNPYLYPTDRRIELGDDVRLLRLKQPVGDLDAQRRLMTQDRTCVGDVLPGHLAYVGSRFKPDRTVRFVHDFGSKLYVELPLPVTQFSTAAVYASERFWDMQFELAFRTTGWTGDPFVWFGRDGAFAPTSASAAVSAPTSAAVPTFDIEAYRARVDAQKRRYAVPLTWRRVLQACVSAQLTREQQMDLVYFLCKDPVRYHMQTLLHLRYDLAETTAGGALGYLLFYMPTDEVATVLQRQRFSRCVDRLRADAGGVELTAIDLSLPPPSIDVDAVDSILLNVRSSRRFTVLSEYARRIAIPGRPTAVNWTQTVFMRVSEELSSDVAALWSIDPAIDYSYTDRELAVVQRAHDGLVRAFDATIRDARPEFMLRSLPDDVVELPFSAVFDVQFRVYDVRPVAYCRVFVYMPSDEIFRTMTLEEADRLADDIYGQAQLDAELYESLL